MAMFLKSFFEDKGITWFFIRAVKRAEFVLFFYYEAFGFSLFPELYEHLFLGFARNLIEEHRNGAQKHTYARHHGNEGENGEALPVGKVGGRRNKFGGKHLGGLKADDHIEHDYAACREGVAYLVYEALAGRAEAVVAVSKCTVYKSLNVVVLSLL